ncbi:unnamed protein product [Ixodes pacificus]
MDSVKTKSALNLANVACTCAALRRLSPKTANVNHMRINRTALRQTYPFDKFLKDVADNLLVNGACETLTPRKTRKAHHRILFIGDNMDDLGIGVGTKQV